MRISLQHIGAAALLACAPVAGAAAQSQDLTPDRRGAYVAVAGGSDLYEIKSGEIAQEKSRRPEIRDYAQQMITEHGRATEQLLEAARAAGLEALPPAMMPFQWELLRKLEDSSRSRFDGRYLDQQVEAHEIALEMHRNFATNGDDPGLRALAQDWADMAQRHLDEAKRLEQSLDG